MLEDTKENRLMVLDTLGYEEFKKREYVSSIFYYEKYIEIDQTNYEVYNTLGYLYRKAGNNFGNFEKQIMYFEKALELKPDYIQALRNLAITYPFVDRYDEAVECFQKLLKLGPVMDDYVRYSYLKIQLGDFEEGWKYFEYRFKQDYMPVEYPEIDKPRWEGQKLIDKTLLVQYEQGFGDTIQFLRYLEQVKPLVKKIVFRVQNELLDLIKFNLKGIEVVPMDTRIEELNFDYHIPLMSLPYVLKAKREEIPLSQGYIKADKAKIQKYKEKFFNNNSLKIGIAYSGMKLGNKRRNVPLECFYPLAQLENVKIYCFQKGFASKELLDIPANMEIVDLGKTFENFSDTASALANLDLFITSDNGIFNLAGAMGIKTYLLLDKYAEWRWFLDNKKTPWYESAEIFKKKDEYDKWDLLIQEVIKNIGAKF